MIINSLKNIKTLLMLSFIVLLGACSTVDRMIYKIDVNQGNYLETSKINQLKQGMTKDEVLYLLGTPLLVKDLNLNRWNYVFLKQDAYKKPVQKNLTITFIDNKVVSIDQK